MEPLCDPKNDRKVKTIAPPPQQPLSEELLFPNSLSGKPDWKALKRHFSSEGKLTKQHIKVICNMAQKVFKNEGNLLKIHDPITVVGDIHGQYYDLLKILEVGGDPESNKFLFLGDYVDRGAFSFEVIMLMFCLKINFPETISMLRGNHECRQMTEFFNFRAECLYKYDDEIYNMVCDCFDCLPLSCILNGKFLAVHGGISPDLKKLKDLKKINRFQEPPKSGIMCDLLWADPIDNEEGKCPTVFKANKVRGCSYYYGADAACKFLEKNNLLTIIRAHEAQVEGFKMHKWGGSFFPLVITIFSAPNYCDTYNNKGAVIKFDKNTLNIQQFNFTPHPYYLPDFMDVLTWSIPFVAEKVTEMFFHLVKHTEEDGFDENDFEEINFTQLSQEEKTKRIEEKKEILRNKVKFLSKVLKMQKTLRENRETIIHIKDKYNHLPKGLLLEGKEALEAFTSARKDDLVNEKRPEKK